MISVPGLYTFRTVDWDFDFLADPTEQDEGSILYIVTAMRIVYNEEFPFIDYFSPDSDMNQKAVLLTPYYPGFLEIEFPEYFI